MVSQRIRKACIGLCLSLILLSGSTLLSDEKTELYLLEQALSVCSTTEVQDAVVRVFLGEWPFLGEHVDSTPAIPFVECGVHDMATIMEVISRLDEKTRDKIFQLTTQPPDLEEKEEREHFIVYYSKEGFNATTQEFAKKVADTLEHKVYKIAKEWGYKEPSSGSESSNGKYKVEIRPLIGMAGTIRASDGRDGTVVVVNKELDNIENEAQKDSKILSLCGHEYFHAIQCAYLSPNVMYKPGYFPILLPEAKKYQWVIEGTAEWMEHEIFREYYRVGFGYPSVNEFVKEVNAYLETTWAVFGVLPYSTVAYWFFIADNSRINFSGAGAKRRDVMRKFWVEMGNDYENLDEGKKIEVWNHVYSNLNEALSSAESEYNTFDKSFKAFAQSNYFKDVDAVSPLTPWYARDNQFTQDMTKVGRVNKKHIKLSRYVKPSSDLSITLDPTTGFGEGILPVVSYSSFYFEIENDTDSDQDLTISFTGDSSHFWMAFSDAANENSKKRIVGNKVRVCIRKEKTGLVIVGRLLRPEYPRTYKLSIEKENACKSKTKKGTYESGAGDETCNPSLDLIFVIDVTGSMWDDIAAVKSSATTIVDAIASTICDYRVGIVAYRDHTDSVMFQDYAFSKDRDTIVSNINSLTVSGGGDWEEAVYDALMRALDSTSIGGWRERVQKKIIILMGDAPPHIPCPVYGYTAKDVIEAAYNVDPAIIYSVCVGSNAYTYETFEEVSEGTGGEVFTALTAEDVVAALLDAVGTAIIRPPEPESAAVLVPEQPDVPPPDYNEMIRPLALENIRKAQDLQAEVDNLVKDVTSQGKEIPEEMMNLIELAQVCIEKAEYYRTTGNFIAANYWAIQAQELLREVIQALKDLNLSSIIFFC